jgi:hypothetical protein
MSETPSRRDFIRTGAAFAVGAALPGAKAPSRLNDESPAGTGPWPRGDLGPRPMERVRVGFVGCGGQGMTHVETLLSLEGVEMKAICDIRPEAAAAAASKTVAAGQPEPTLYTRGPRDFERMCDEMELDLVFNATPWEWHLPVMLAAMKAGKHVATEVPAAMTVDDCWKIVELAEKTRLHCVMMENCNYDRFELMTLNLVRKGLLGEILHGEAGYLHDLRWIKFQRQGEGLWRRAWATHHNANLYPTHGLGPIANCMDINRGDRFERVVSFSSPSRGLQEWQRTLPADDERRRERYVLGDMNVALIQTARGRTIYLAHNTNNPRPYSRLQLLQGTRGIVSGWPYRVHIEGTSPAHQWQDAREWYDEHEHPLWKSKKIQEMDRGHGGMDFLEDYRLIQCLRRGEPMDMDVYDAAALSCLVELTGRSVAGKGKPQEVPDFTRGRWKSRAPWGIVGE